MTTVLAAARYLKIGFSIYFAVTAQHVTVPGGINFHLEPGTIRTRTNQKKSSCTKLYRRIILRT